MVDTLGDCLSARITSKVEAVRGSDLRVPSVRRASKGDRGRAVTEDIVVGFYGDGNAKFHWPLQPMLAILSDANEASSSTTGIEEGARLSQQVGFDWLWGRRTGGTIGHRGASPRRPCGITDVGCSDTSGVGFDHNPGCSWRILPQQSYRAARVSSATTMHLPQHGARGERRMQNDWLRVSVHSRFVGQSPFTVPTHDLYRPRVRGANIAVAITHPSAMRDRSPATVEACSAWADGSLEVQRDTQHGICPTFFLDAAALVDGRRHSFLSSCGIGVQCGPLRIECARHQAKTKLLVSVR